MSNKTKEEILKECLGENNIDNQKIRYSVYKAMEKYAEQKQKDIDELVEFIDRQISESNFINEGDKFEAYELIKKYKDNDNKGN